MIAVSVIHMLDMFCVWHTILRSLGFDLWRYITAPVVLLGLIAILSYFIIYVTSVGWFRQLYYEVFLGLHIIFQVMALASSSSIILQRSHTWSPHSASRQWTDSFGA
jgi:hypothetical protein